MTDRDDRKATVVPEEVLELLEQRAQIEGWLDKLREIRDDCTPEVYEKVRSDYAGRLGDVNGRLAEHRSELESSLERHRARVEELEGGRAEAAAKLEEAKIRFRVGEYGDGEWEKRRAESEAKIEGLDADLNEERDALSALEKVLGDLAGGGPSTPDTPERREEGPPSEEEDLVKGWGGGRRGLVTASEENGGQQPAGAKASGAATGSSRRSSGTEAEEVAQPAATGSPSETLDVPEEESDDYLDELEFLESLSLDDAEHFDAVSLMLDENEPEGESKGGDRSEPPSA